MQFSHVWDLDLLDSPSIKFHHDNINFHYSMVYVVLVIVGLKEMLKWIKNKENFIDG